MLQPYHYTVDTGFKHWHKNSGSELFDLLPISSLFKVSENGQNKKTKLDAGCRKGLHSRGPS